MRNLPFKFLYLFTLVVFLRPQELFPGLPAIPFADISVAGALLSYFLPNLGSIESLLKERESKILIGILLCILFTLPFGLWPGGSFKALTETFLKVFIVYFLILGILDSPERILKVIWLIAICVTIYAVLGVFDYVQGRNLMLGRLTGRATGIYGNPNDFGINLCLTLPFLLFLSKVTESALKKWMLYGAMLVNFTAMVFTYSRTGMLALMMLLLGVIATSKNTFRNALLAVVLASALTVTIMPERFVNRTISIINPSMDEVGSRQARITILKEGVNAFIERPFLGVGFGNFPIAEGASHGGVGHWKEAHNGYVEVAVELGIFGLMLYLGLLYSTFTNLKNLKRGIEENDDFSFQLHLCQSLRIMLWTYLIATFFGTSTFSWVFIFLLGFSVGLRRWLSAIGTS